MYHYAGNNPVKYTDPDGNFDKESFRDFVHNIIANPYAVSYAQNGIFPNETFGFSFDSSEGVFHTTFDCWQSLGGYNDFYDKVFDLATSMEAVKFEFSSGGEDYCLWGWKGDYLNLGAGCEMGLYRKADGKLGQAGHYLADKKTLAMDVQATLFVNGKKAGTYDSGKLGKHWWPAIFNPSQQGKNKDSIHAQYNITMPNGTLYDAFKQQLKNRPELSNWNDENNSFTVNY